LTDWRGKHVLITGGSGGLGKSLAIKCASYGANITIIARNQTKLKEAHSLVEKAAKNPNQKVLSFSADVCDWNSIQSTVSKAESVLGVVDVLFANAGSSHPGYFFEQKVEDLAQEMKLNYLGVVHAIKAVLPGMVNRDKGGHICIISSAAAFVPIIGYANYSATKTALKGLAEALRHELLLYGIDVSIYFPTGIDTEGFAEEQKTKPKETKEIEGATTPLVSPELSAEILLRNLKKGAFYVVSELIPGDLTRSLCHPIHAPRSNFLWDLIITPICVFIDPANRVGMDQVVYKSRSSAKKRQ